MARARRTLALPARAKVNLHLDVGDRRKDGYHDLSTLFQEISLEDTLSLSLTDGPSKLTVTPAGLPTGAENLVLRALDALRAALKTKSGFHARLIKRIPVGAGLGGGSADAAAALRGGWALLKGGGRLPLKRIPPLLPKLARKLGADVPFFLRGGTAWGEGIGEKLTPVHGCPRRWLVLVYPRVHVATAAAYRLLDASRKRKPSRRRGRVEAAHLRPGNSFEAVIFPHFPAVAAARAALASAGCSGVMMSGSGSSVFGFVESRPEGERIARALRGKPWDVFVAHTVS